MDKVRPLKVGSNTDILVFQIFQIHRYFRYVQKFALILGTGTHSFVKYHVQKQPPLVFCKKGVLRNFSKFTGKHLC